jgi:alkaline phosphatase D
MKISLTLLLSWSLFLISCAQTQLAKFVSANPEAMKIPASYQPGEVTMPLGRFAMVQGPTSASETFISIITPRYKNYTYVLLDGSGKEISRVLPYEVIKQDNYTFWKIDKIHFDKLMANTEYGIQIVDKKDDKQSLVDFRTFKTFPESLTSARFVVGSCSSDDHRFALIRKPIWSKVVALNPDFIIMNGDVVYVDSFEFVKRENKDNKTQAWEVWQRYIDSFNTIEIFRSQRIYPIIANWDDHDMGTNNSDINFSQKDYAKKIFKGLFHSANINGIFKQGPIGVSSSYYLFGQKFIIMDGRYLRQPPGTQKAPWGQLGKLQHEWVMAELNSSAAPTWMIMGDQFFTQLVEVGAGATKKIVNETFIGDHPVHFTQFMKEVKNSAAPVIFVSGDVHFSEISTVDPSFLGYPTFEVTASPYHSFIFGGKSWENPKRIAIAKEHNFLYVETEAKDSKIKARIRSIGVAAEPYFEKEIQVSK